MKNRLYLFLALILLFTVSLTACADRRGGPFNETELSGEAGTTAAEGQPFYPDTENAYQLTDGVYITGVESYTGSYVEDGSGEKCKKICAVRLENRSDTHYQYLRFRLTTTDETYTFAATTLFAGAKMTVLCEDRLTYKNKGVLSVELLSAAPFTQTPTVHLDEMKITYTEGFINVQNLTDAPLSNVYVYYKNTDDTGFFGGITYRVSFGEIPAGGTVQAGAANMHPDACKVVFSTYDP